MSDAARLIEQLRRDRVPPARETSISNIVNAVSKQATRTNKRLGQLIDLWLAHVPPAIAAKSTILSLRGGTLHVAVDDASTSYELDRLLREGLEQTLRAQFRSTLVRVKVRVSNELSS